MGALIEIGPAYADAIPEAPAPDVEGNIDPGDSGERLVLAAENGVCHPAYSGIATPRGCLPPRLREEVLARLVTAQATLPRPFQLILLDGWRSRAFQEELGAHYGAQAVKADFVADAEDDTIIPPHVTGGAVDLTIGVEGRPLALGSEFDEFTPRAHLTSLEAGPPSHERLLRRVLYRALVDQGFAPYALEWWHFSYGDQNWARFYGFSRAIYGEAEV